MIAEKKTVNPTQKITHLGLGHIIARMKRCHQLLGELLGIQFTAEIQVEGVAQFESAIGQLISVVVLQYAKENDADRELRELLIGPFKRHVEAYREEQRRRQQKLSQSKPEPTIKTDPKAD